MSHSGIIAVSVLFSEPKIPQTVRLAQPLRSRVGFSALQRAENSSNHRSAFPSASAREVSVLFSEPKIPQIVPSTQTAWDAVRFSALQRAENSSNVVEIAEVSRIRRFSALQRAENSSKRAPPSRSTIDRRFQCSSASRKFLKISFRRKSSPPLYVSVLFSEPKIPQTG